MTAPSASRRFRYRAATAAGASVDGVLRAASREQAVEALRRQALWPVAVDPVEDDAAGSWQFGGAAARRRDLAVWTRTLATLLGAGTPLDRAMQVAATQVRDPRVQQGIRTVQRKVLGGAALAQACRDEASLFDAVDVAMIEAGEATGALDAALDRLATYREEDESWRAQLAAALLYPALLAAVAAVGVLVLLLFVLPRFAVLLGDLGGRLPLTTRLVIGAGEAVRATWWWGLPLLAILVAAIRAALADPGRRDRWHAVRLQLPVIGRIDREIATARFTRLLGALLDGGLPLLASLRLATAGVTNAALAGALRRAADAVARGEPLATHAAEALTPLAAQLLAVGEESAQLAAMAARAADAHEESLRRTLRAATSLIEPVMIILFGGLVGVVALAMLQAIYAVNAGVP